MVNENSFQVAADGYGVSYIITTEDLIFFHISSNKSSPETVKHDLNRFISVLIDIFSGFKTIRSMYSSSNDRYACSVCRRIEIELIAWISKRKSNQFH